MGTGAALNDEQYQALAKFLARHLAAEKAGIEAMRRTLQESREDQPTEAPTPDAR